MTEAANDNWPTHKTCSKCGETKPLTEFHNQPTGKFGRHSYCAKCACAIAKASRIRNSTPEQKERWTLKTRYGITPEERDAKLAAQGGKCAICREVPARPCIDHNHDTGQIRGILCHHCNIRLPSVENDNYRIPAMAYLAFHSIERAAA